MSNPSGPDPEATGTTDESQAVAPDQEPPERRFTAPSGFDGKATEIIGVSQEPATEVITVHDSPGELAEPVTAQIDPPEAPPRTATPQVIPPRADVLVPHRYRSWGWVLALILVIVALAAVAVLGTVVFTRASSPQISQEEQVEQTIQHYAVAIQKGDLPALLGMTCGTDRDSLSELDERAWADLHARVAATKRFPMVASIDQVVVNGDHAEANVTAFMAYAPQTRSTRSIDLQLSDGQWKICQPF